jgi:hypothetical protein
LREIDVADLGGKALGDGIDDHRCAFKVEER